ncbi:MAG: hypothetical protein GYA61_08370 [Spirochaetales bacterium]|nr:hypothetical protein [Spirochaetales bacterium]
MKGVPCDKVKIRVGETVVIYARIMSKDGKWFELPVDVDVNCKADTEFEVTPITGHVITVKIIKPISGVSFVTATTTMAKSEKIEKFSRLRVNKT